MSNFFEQELRKLFGDGALIQSPTFAGRACLGRLDGELRVRAEFATTGMADHYSALRLTVMNRTEGVVDRNILRFKDILGMKQVPGNPNFRGGVSPHIWDDHGKAAWYAYHPSGADYQAMRRAAGQYLDAFRERTPERVRNGPKLVYICAPLRGEVEKNIEFAAKGAGGVPERGCPGLSPPHVPAHRRPHTPDGGPGGAGDGPAAGGLLPTAQCVRPHLDGRDVGRNPPRRGAGHPRHDGSEAARQSDAPLRQETGEVG